MKRISFHTSYALVLLIVGTLVANPTLADKPAWAGASDKGETKGKGHARDRDKESDRVPERRSTTISHFSDRHRVVIRDYYVGQFQAGRCPPGLAKKRNGCMPPGQAKKWHIGRCRGKWCSMTCPRTLSWSSDRRRQVTVTYGRLPTSC